MRSKSMHRNLSLFLCVCLFCHSLCCALKWYVNMDRWLDMMSLWAKTAEFNRHRHCRTSSYDMHGLWYGNFMTIFQFEIRQTAQLTFRCFFIRQKMLTLNRARESVWGKEGKNMLATCNIIIYIVSPHFFSLRLLFCIVMVFSASLSCSFFLSASRYIFIFCRVRTELTFFRCVISFCCCFFCFFSFRHVHFDFVPGNSCWTE